MQIQGFEFYGGATVTTITDGSGAEWIACCARKLSTGVFGFYLFRNGVEAPYTPFCTGRGSINGGGKWIAAKDKEFFSGLIPGFVGYSDHAATIAGLRQEIAALRQQVAELAARAPVPGPLGIGDREVLDRYKRLHGIQD